MTQAQRFYEDYKDLDVNDLIHGLDEANIESDQDYENETTTWTFSDDSCIKVNNTRVTIIEDDAYIDLENYSYKNHTRKQLKIALRTGEPIWILDTDHDGKDDLLIGEEEEVIIYLLNHFELDKLPSHWKLSALRGKIQVVRR